MSFETAPQQPVVQVEAQRASAAAHAGPISVKSAFIHDIFSANGKATEVSGVFDEQGAQEFVERYNQAHL